MTTKRVQIQASASIIDAAETALVDLERRFAHFIETEDETVFNGASLSAHTAIEALKEPIHHDYVIPSSVDEALDQTAKQEQGTKNEKDGFEMVGSGLSRRMALSSEQEVLMGEILQEARVKLSDHPQLYNRVRTILIRDFTDSITDGFDTDPLVIEPEDAKMGGAGNATKARPSRRQ